MTGLKLAAAGVLVALAVGGAANSCAVLDAATPTPAAPTTTGGKPTCTQANSFVDFFTRDCVEPAPDPAKPYPTTELDKSDGGQVPEFLPGGYEALCDPATGSIQELRPDTPDTRAKAAKECAR
ncbi:hypothetical protein [Kutzneria sp. CA-103260]|uniref:hypothetical protein n=1 Tax=Kutzneria sp. CA-103260 TaxID=2802641 RepID=UPI001BACEF31|nr:hypothetical protein [Kutzneria sp. CA-103260]QUQ70578.1 hypothetical protein JJ691_83580 [Kutzneria sp. CA-103260]